MKTRGRHTQPGGRLTTYCANSHRAAKLRIAHVRGSRCMDCRFIISVSSVVSASSFSHTSVRLSFLSHSSCPIRYRRCVISVPSEKSASSCPVRPSVTSGQSHPSSCPSVTTVPSVLSRPSRLCVCQVCPSCLVHVLKRVQACTLLFP